jgi:hypothetical protein
MSLFVACAHQAAVPAAQVASTPVPERPAPAPAPASEASFNFDPSGAKPSIETAEVAPEVRVALQTAASWLVALRQHDTSRLAALTAFPFNMRTSGTEAGCDDFTIDTAGLMPDGLRCMFEDKLLESQWQDLSSMGVLAGAKLLDPAQLPVWTALWRRELGSQSKLVSVDVPGNGASIQFILVLRDDAVSALWKDVSYESD